ncbi:MAG: 3,4-dihydroxy-2-butanone-4-phosphate synthase [Levilactobacillus brevis]
MTSRVEDALTALKRGQLVIVADAEDREAEGDLVGIGRIGYTGDSQSNGDTCSGIIVCAHGTRNCTTVVVATNAAAQ